MNIRLIKSVEVAHRAFGSSEVVARTDYIQTPDGVVAVDYWHNWQTGKLARVAAPRPLRAGETV